MLRCKYFPYIFTFSEVSSGSFDSTYIIAGGFGFGTGGAAPTSTGAAAGAERGQLDRLR